MNQSRLNLTDLRPSKIAAPLVDIPTYYSVWVSIIGRYSYIVIYSYTITNYRPIVASDKSALRAARCNLAITHIVIYICVPVDKSVQGRCMLTHCHIHEPTLLGDHPVGDFFAGVHPTCFVKHSVVEYGCY